MEIVRHIRHRPGCYCCHSNYELESEYPSVLQNRVSEHEWAIALGELNAIIHHNGPNPLLWALISFVSFLPLIILIPILTVATQVYFNVWIWIMVAEFVFFFIMTIALVARSRRFIVRLEAGVAEINRRFHGRGVHFKMCHHHHHGYYRRNFHHSELVVTVEGVAIVQAYQGQGMPPMYGAPVVIAPQFVQPNYPQQQQQQQQQQAQGMVPPGYPMPAGYVAVPQQAPPVAGPAFQNAPPPGFEMPPPQYYADKDGNIQQKNY